MRILQVHNRYREPGGEDAVVDRERHLLIEGGHEVELLEFANPAGGVAAARALLSAPWNAKAAETVVATARRFGAEVIHVHNTWFALSPAVFPGLSSAGFPTVLTVHNYRLSCVNAILYRNDRICEECVGHLPWRGIVHRCYRGSALQSAAVAVTIGTHRGLGTWKRSPDVVVALTRFAAQYLTTAGVPEDSITVKPNVVADPGARNAPPSSSRVLLFVGRLSREKGVEDLVEAWKQTDSEHLRLVIVGDGPLRSFVDHAAAASTGIEVAGRLDDGAVAEAMKEARALVFPSRWFEGMPMVLLEALAAGLPLVVPDHGALPEIVGEGGLTYRSGSVPDLTRVLDEVRDDRLVDSMSRHARANYQANFGAARGLDALERIYQIAIRKRARR